MQILHIPFEEPLKILLNGEELELFAFQTAEHGNIKFGVRAPRSIQVHREEVYNAIKKKQQQDES